MAKNEELKAIVCAQKCFLVWPKTGQTENVEAKPGKKLVKKPCVLSVRLNAKVMQPFVGWSDLFRKIGHVDYLTRAFLYLNDEWAVSGL